MAKKIFARARVVKGKRWYIDYVIFDPVTSKESRHRQDFDLNDIEDLAVRELVAARLVTNLGTFIKSAPVAASSAAPAQTVSMAIQIALDVKFKLPRRNSRSQYRTVGRMFLKWSKQRHYLDLPIADFSQKYAREFWDWMTTKKYAGRTLNNYRTCLKALWSELIEREVITKNIWERIKPARVGEKKRRPFTDQERRVVAAWAKEHDYWMFRGILLQYFCYIRPGEISGMKFRDFDFAAGTVTIPEGNSKSWKKRVVTLPKSILHYFLDGQFDQYPGNYFVLGRIPARNGRWAMHPSTVALSETRMNKRHARLLARLQKSGDLSDISGLTWYSWKDTGISVHARKTSPIATKDQAGHRDLAITSLYYHAEEINSEYRNLADDLL